MGDRLDASVLEKAVQETNASIVITDRRGRILFVNPAFTRISGYTEEEVLGRSSRILKSGLVDPRVYQDLWRTITAGRQWAGDFINRAKDGTLYHEHASIAPVTGADGEISHYVAVKEDITDQQRTLANLRRSNARLASILESQRFLVVRVDREGRYTYANETFLNTFGLTHEALMDMHFDQITHPDDVDAVRAALQDAAASPGKTVAVASRKPLPGGPYLWIDWEFVAIDGTSHQGGSSHQEGLETRSDGALEIQAVGHRAQAQAQARAQAQAQTQARGAEGDDPGQRGGNPGGPDPRDARAAMRAREQDLRRILDAVQELVFVFDDELRILEVNEAVSELLGTPRRELLGRTMFDAVRPTELGKFALALDDVRDHEETKSRITVIGRGGAPVDLELACHRTEYQGRPAVLCSGRRRGVESSSLRGAQSDAGATPPTPERLRERGSAALEPIARTLADLRGNHRHYEPRELDAILSTLEAGVAGVHHQITNYIDARGDDGTVPASCTQVLPVPRLVDAGISLVRSMAQGKNVELDLLGDSELLIRVNAEALRLVVRNLVANAVKYSRSGDRVEISWHASGEDAVVTVVDEGTGLSDDDLELLSAGTAPPTRPGTAGERGIGAGLAVTFRALSRLNGRIDFSRRAGGGTHVRLILARALARVSVA